MVFRKSLDKIGLVSENVFMYHRLIETHLKEFLGKKIILLSGPRQVGKTTLSKNLINDTAYYNYDIKRDLAVFTKHEWDKEKELVVFDELHKMKNWKLWLKGLYDEGHLKKQSILVTGSARLNITKKMGDSLAGRFFSYRLHPLDLKELKYVLGKKFNLEENYKKLIGISNFPEPFFEGTQKFYSQWRRGHIDLIVRQDLLSLEKVRDIEGIELLIELLSKRVGSTISYKSLSEDLDRDDKTIKKWITVLENLYVGFKVTSYSKNIARGKKKAFKFYFYDLGNVDGDEGAKLENLVALSFLKELDFIEDAYGVKGNLYFIQTRNGKEIDFYIQLPKNRDLIVEVKVSDSKISDSFNVLSKNFKSPTKIQLVRNLDRSFQNKDGVHCLNALTYLSNLDLST